ncbi:MAG TPA: hypothetical protein PL093_01305 [Candidatus Pacearchaeota archaeon]|jgi:hypothetical protein|nr:hypothetical protein [Candidatus Pacearchaeota archaeon]HRR94826.1 hypothetical protein [Candidatus Paceibacterota bacterium]HPC30584.1 hypothetical protein [Candidatus Pacearchaeota archaeon]HQG09328.1 hypothetical protein [Candidatus Pacearchaeota archaeon]HQH20198.1 hypothetical protein [Candidatus Pacearchaeota archaeon]
MQQKIGESIMFLCLTIGMWIALGIIFVTTAPYYYKMAKSH